VQLDGAFDFFGFSHHLLGSVAFKLRLHILFAGGTGILKLPMTAAAPNQHSELGCQRNFRGSRMSFGFASIRLTISLPNYLKAL
jgi:hypothetical protein